MTPEELQNEEIVAGCAQAIEMLAEEFKVRALGEAIMPETDASKAEEALVVAALKDAGCLHKNAQGDMLAAFMGCRPMFVGFLKVVGIILESTGISKGIKGWSIVAHGDNGAVIVSRITRGGDPDAIAPVGALLERKA